MKLKNRVSIITGATRGIGWIISKYFVLNGSSVIIVGRNLAKGKEAEELLLQEGGKAKFIQTDISKEDEVENMIENTISIFGGIDILVNNAAVTGRGDKFYDMSLNEWENYIDTNLTGTFLCSKYAAKEMIKNNSGKIVNISSVYGSLVSPGTSAYSSSKAGINQLTKAMAIDLSEYKVNVNCVAPGAIETAEKKEHRDPKLEKALLENIILKRRGKAEEVAKLVVFLASDDSDYINGETITIDGGLTTHFQNY